MAVANHKLIADLDLQGLDPLHQEAVLSWFGGELLKRTLVRMDPSFASFRPRDLVRLSEREDNKAKEIQLSPKDKEEVNKGDSAIFDEEMRQLKKELASGPLRWIADPASDSASFTSAMSSAPRLFLSYSHADKRFANRLSEDLRQRGFAVWQDDRDLRVGDSLAESIRKAIDRADYVLMVVSTSSAESIWVRRELDIALEAELNGHLKRVLPVLRGEVDLPSALAGRVYADFLPRRYAQGLQRLLDTLGWDLDSMPVMVSSILRSKTIAGVVDYLNGRGWSAQARWSPLPVRTEITAGYLSYMRGWRGPAAEPAAFPPHSPISVISEFPILAGKGTQIAFGQSRVEYHKKADIQESANAVIQYPTWKFTICIAGPAKHVQATVLLLSMCPALNDGAVDDLGDALKWWAKPDVPAGPSIDVAATPVLPAITIESHL